MTGELGLALSGWCVSAALLAWALLLRGRLELVACAEHELRGPVAALALAAEALGRRAGSRTHALVLEGQVDRLRTALADLSEARRGRRAAGRVEPVALERAVRAAAAGWAPLARRAGGGVRLRWRAGGALVRADRGRLAQALGNVLANAVEHGGADVAVHAAAAPGCVRLEVRDGGPGRGPRSGPGAAPVRSGDPGRERGPDLDRGRGPDPDPDPDCGRGPDPDPDPGPDRGRGLAIARRAVEDAGGRLAIDRQGPGTVVTIELPAHEPPGGGAVA